jgi:peptide/nickel transport system substrate-binding protein
LVSALLLTGCGGEFDSGTATGGLPAAGEAGGIAYALPSLPRSLDPLTAATLPSRVVTAQVHEPLAAVVSTPYGGPPRPAGLAVAFRPSGDGALWTLQLRPGVRFADGTPFNAAAVIANSRRWTSSSEGRALLPELFAVDSPRPGEVRFLLTRPVRDLRRRLSDVRLSIVSPESLDPQSGEGASYTQSADSGTGAFTLSGGLRGGELTRNPSWWGTELGLGPALDSVGFMAVASAAGRASVVRARRAQIAGPLPRRTLGSLGADPLLRAAPGTGGGVAMEASVRGLSGGGPVPRISAVWLTTIDRG